MDHQSTTPVDPRIMEKMLPYFTEIFGNPASRNHVFGWAARGAVEEAREQCAAIINAEPNEIVFTSGATESINMALKGVAEKYREKGLHIITTAVEHLAVLDTLRRLESCGFRLTILPVDGHGELDPAQLEESITDETILVSTIFANNEIGTINRIGELGAVCRRHGVIFHTDASQAVGKISIDVEEMSIDLLSCSAHKMYGPKGVGLCYVRGVRGVRGNARSFRTSPDKIGAGTQGAGPSRVPVSIIPLIDGGGHERGFRSGTLNVPGIVGMGEAMRISALEMKDEANRLIHLRERLRSRLMEKIDETRLNGHPERRIPGNLNLSFAYAEGEALMMGIKEIAVSTGSACTSASLKPSHVLKAIGLSDEMVHSSIRFGLGRTTTEEEIDFTAERVVEEVARLRDLSPFYGTVALSGKKIPGKPGKKQEGRRKASK